MPRGELGSFTGRMQSWRAECRQFTPLGHSGAWVNAIAPYVDLQAAGRRTQRQSMACPRGPNYRERVSVWLISLIYTTAVWVPQQIIPPDRIPRVNRRSSMTCRRCTARVRCDPSRTARTRESSTLPACPAVGQVGAGLPRSWDPDRSQRPGICSERFIYSDHPRLAIRVPSPVLY